MVEEVKVRVRSPAAEDDAKAAGPNTAEWSVAPSCRNAKDSYRGLVVLEGRGGGDVDIRDDILVELPAAAPVSVPGRKPSEIPIASRSYSSSASSICAEYRVEFLEDLLLSKLEDCCRTGESILWQRPCFQTLRSAQRPYQINPSYNVDL